MELYCINYTNFVLTTWYISIGIKLGFTFAKEYDITNKSMVTCDNEWNRGLANIQWAISHDQLRAGICACFNGVCFSPCIVGSVEKDYGCFIFLLHIL